MLWIKLTVMNQRFQIDSEISVLVSEICLLQQYEVKEDVLHPGIPEANPPIAAQLETGHPAFCAVSLKSGLQFRVLETKDGILLRVDI